MAFLRNRFWVAWLVLAFSVTLIAPMLVTTFLQRLDPCGMNCGGVCCCVPVSSQTGNCHTGSSSSLLPNWVSCKPSPASGLPWAVNLFFEGALVLAALTFGQASFPIARLLRFADLTLPPPDGPPWQE